jgi:hypothetical protein
MDTNSLISAVKDELSIWRNSAAGAVCNAPEWWGRIFDNLDAIDNAEADETSRRNCYRSLLYTLIDLGPMTGAEILAAAPSMALLAESIGTLPPSA